MDKPKMVKITMDKEHITPAEQRICKTFIDDIKGCYTEGDFLRIFKEATGWDDWTGEIYQMSVVCLGVDASGVALEVSAIVEGWRDSAPCFFRVHFYANESMKIDIRRIYNPISDEPLYMYSVEIFTMNKGLNPIGLNH